MKIKLFLLAVFVSILCYCNVATAQHLLLAGGELKRESDFFWRKLVQLSGGRDQARIGIITAGKEDPLESSKNLTNILMHYGAKVEWIPVSPEIEDSANQQSAADLVSKQRAIFLDDGDPLKLLRLLRNADGTDTLVLSAMRNVFQRGVVSGSGAGAAVLSGQAVAVSGESYESLVYGSRVFVEGGGRRAQRKFSGCLYVQRGLGFLPSWMIETHFNELGLQGRTIRLLLDTRASDTATARALGVDRQMALALYRVGTDDEFGEVLGARGGISFIDASGAHFQSGPKLDISGVNITFLTEDDKLIPPREVLPAAWKADLSGEEWHFVALASDDIFSVSQNPNRVAGNFNKVAERLFDSALTKRITSTTWQTSPQLVVEMDRRFADSFHNDSPSTAKHLVSYVNLRVGISQRVDV